MNFINIFASTEKADAINKNIFNLSIIYHLYKKSFKRGKWAEGRTYFFLIDTNNKLKSK